MQCRQSRDTWSKMQAWPSSTKWSRAKCFKSFAKRTHWDVLSKTLILFYVDGCGCVPPCYLFGLRWPSPGVYRLSGSAIGDLQGKLDTSPRTAAATAPVPVVGHCQHTPLQEALKHSDMSGSVSCGVNFPFLSVLVWARFCFCAYFNMATILISGLDMLWKNRMAHFFFFPRGVILWFQTLLSIQSRL